MYCIIGLGNPGKQYELTRHNAGFLVIDKLLENANEKLEKGFKSLYCKTSLHNQPVLLVKPQTYMNLSGEAALEITRFYKIPLPKILVVYDDLDLPVGALRFRKNGSAGGHRGLTSIIQLLGSDQIARLKLGIGRPKPPIPVVDYVLTPFTGEEKLLFEDSLSKAGEAVLAYLQYGLDYSMNHFNSKPKPKKELETKE